jgi:hypothetical protein
MVRPPIDGFVVRVLPVCCCRCSTPSANFQTASSPNKSAISLVADGIKEGLAKGIPPERIVRGVHVAGDLASARDRVRRAEQTLVRVEAPVASELLPGFFCNAPPSSLVNAQG